MNRSKRLAGLGTAFGALAITLALTGCGEFFTPVNNNPGGTGTTSYVYALNTGGTLAEYSLASGVLTELSGSPITLPVAATSITVAPNDENLFVGTSTGVFIFTINSDGTLTEGNNDTVIYLNQSGYTVSSMAVDPSGSWLLMAYQNQPEVDALPLDSSTGLPTGDKVEIAYTSKFATTNPQLTINAANTQVFVALGASGVYEIGFTHTAAAPWATTGTNIPVKTANAFDSGVSVDSTSTYLYISEQNNNSTGAIAGTVRLIATANLGADLDDEATGIGPTAVLAEGSGDYVYVTNGNDGNITGYSVSKTTQKLTSLGTTPTEASPVALVEDKSNSYLIDVGNGANPNLWMYGFDTTALGSLDVKTSTSTAATNPSLANGLAITH